jgi:hypothetical protein
MQKSNAPMRVIIAIALIMFSSLILHAQNDLFGTPEKQPPRKGFVFSVNGNFDMSGADMAKRFGTSYRVGGSVNYKTTSNWIFGPKFDFILGNTIREDSFLVNQMDETGRIFNQNGSRTRVAIYERGYIAGIQGGKIFNLSKKNGDNGLLIMTAAGFMQHKINIFDRERTITSIDKSYKKGYDRLSNGIFIEEYIAYSYFARDGLINFHIGFDITAGFTKCRRDFLYDVMRPDNQSRIDLLFGIRGGWYLPVFKRKSEEVFF